MNFPWTSKTDTFTSFLMPFISFNFRIIESTNLEKSSKMLIWAQKFYCHYIVGNKEKGWISTRAFQENKTGQIFRKTNMCTCAYKEARNIRFSKNLTCFVSLKHPFWDAPFCLTTNKILTQCKKSDKSNKPIREDGQTNRAEKTSKKRCFGISHYMLTLFLSFL